MSGQTHRCIETLFDVANSPTNPMHGLAGAMAVSEDEPLIVAPEFPPQRMRCPHGTRFYAYPNAERIQALRDLDQGGG